MRPLAWGLAGLLAAAAVYLAVTGAHPLWTLAAGVGVGALIAAAGRPGARRGEKDRQR